MIDSMDISFVLVNISPTNLIFSKITEMISSVINPLIESNYDVRLSLITFRFDDRFEEPVVYPFTRSLAHFKHWFYSSYVAVRRRIVHGTTAICDTLREALHLDWRTSSLDRCHENVVFLITDTLPCQHLIDSTTIEQDDNPCACDGLWNISDEFVNQNITLMIIGIGEIVSICDTLYGAIAKNTGGEYTPLTNASHVLFSTIQSVVTQGYTLSQALRHIKREEFEKNSPYHCSMTQKRDQSEIKHCQIMAQKGAWLLNDVHQVTDN